MHRILALAGLLAVVSQTATASPTVELESPLRRSFEAADLAKAPPGAIPLQVGGLPSLWNATSVRLTDMPMPDGRAVTLNLTRQESPVEAFWLLSRDALGIESREHIPAPPVLLLAGNVDGEPDSGVFLGLTGDRVQGWIETDDGLHLISTPPNGGPTLLFRVGDARGGVDLPGPGPVKDVGTQGAAGQTNPFVPTTDLDRLLVELQDPDSPVRRRFLEHGGASKIPQLLDLVAGDVDPNYETGACCIGPGFCLQLTASWCGLFCPGASDTFCGNTWTGPPVDFNTGNLPPCWLGAGVPCGGMWTCYESYDNPSNPNDPANGNWFGPCCVGGVLQELAACECAMEGGRFVAPPAICLGEDLASPQQMDAINFATLAEIQAIDPNICSKPTGACCIEQQVLCEDIADPDSPLWDLFKRVTCLELPRGICEDPDIIKDVFNGMGDPGYFVKECFPCATTGFGDSICPSSMQLESGGVAPPPQLDCQSARLTVDTDWWYLERFGGDQNAAAAYTTMLMASINWILERDAMVNFQIGDVIIRGAGAYGPAGGSPYVDPDFLVTGACCVEDEGLCRESRTEQWCREYGTLWGHTTTWLGPGSSCWDATDTPCTDVYPSTSFDVYNEQDATPFTIEDIWQQMRDEWNAIGNSQSHPLKSVRNSSNLILLLSGYPFERPYWYSDMWQEWGIETQVAYADGNSLCAGSANPYVVAAAKGTFPWPGEPFDRDNVNWDLIAAIRGLGLAIGLSSNNSDFGFDNCDGPPCIDMDITTDCMHRYYFSALGAEMPATLMSYCISCPGGSANLQLRFRSEQAANIYARFASMDCRADGAGTPDPSQEDAPYAVDDLYIDPPDQDQYFDVLLNDVAPGCWDQHVFDPATWDPDDWDPETDPWPQFPIVLTQLGVPDPNDLNVIEWFPDNDPGLPAQTVMGGTVDIVEDPSDPTRLMVLYTPPSEFCGIDYFEYEIETDPPFVPDPNSPDPDNPDPLFFPVTDTAFVRILQESCTNGQQDIHNLANYPPQSVAEPPVAPTPPAPNAVDVIMLSVLSPATQLNRVSWTNLVLMLADPSSTSPGEAFFRVWGVREAGVSLYGSDPNGVPYAIFYDIHPFGGPGECGPTTPFTWGGENPVGPSSGECDAPAAFYTSTEGNVLLQCLEESDDLPGADAWWTKGLFCVSSDSLTAAGACCVGGMCIQTDPYDCVAMGWTWEWVFPGSPTSPSYQPGHWDWVYDSASAGFFMGNGTACNERDWCRRTAPCCYDLEPGRSTCALLTCEECLQLGGRMLTLGYHNNVGDYVLHDGTQYCDPNPYWSGVYPDGPPQPLWDTPCEYPVCNLDFTHYPAGPPVVLNPPDPGRTMGACCVSVQLNPPPAAPIQFCTDLSRDNCEAYDATSLSVSTTWSIRGRCEDVPCAVTGACCIVSPVLDSCVDGIDAATCGAYWSEDPNNPPNPPTSVSFHSGETCSSTPCDLAAVGACCVASVDACCDGFTREACQLVSGTFLGGGSNCLACTSASANGGVCSIDASGIGVCTDDVSQFTCELSLLGTWYADIQTCNESIPDVGAGLGGSLGACCYEYECIGSVTERDCILAGGIPIPKSDNPFHPNCDETPPPVAGACCYDNNRYGRVCINQTEVVCLSLPGGTWCDSGLCGQSCSDPSWTSCPDIDLCSPGECLLPWGIAITADRERCESVDGQWIGQIASFAEPPPRSAGDLNGDGRVNTEDLLRLIAAWGIHDGAADLTGDGRVDVADLRRLLALWR